MKKLPLFSELKKLYKKRIFALSRTTISANPIKLTQFDKTRSAIDLVKNLEKSNSDIYKKLEGFTKTNKFDQQVVNATLVAMLKT